MWGGEDKRGGGGGGGVSETTRNPGPETLVEPRLDLELNLSRRNNFFEKFIVLIL